VYEVNALDAFFEESYQESQHPIARRLWDRGHSLSEKEVFIGIPGFFNHACSNCATLDVSTERDDIDCSVGGYFFIYFKSRVHTLARNLESFDLRKEDLMATWEYHYRQTELVFDRCSICKNPITLAGIVDKHSVREAFKYAADLYQHEFFEDVCTVYLEELKKIAVNLPSPGFGLDRNSTNLDLMCKCVFVFSKFCVLNDMQMTPLAELPYLHLIVSIKDTLPAGSCDDFDWNFRALLDLVADATEAKFDEEKEMWCSTYEFKGAKVNLKKRMSRKRKELLKYFEEYCDKCAKDNGTGICSPGKLICALQVLHLTSRNGRAVDSMWLNVRIHICAALHQVIVTALDSPKNSETAFHLYWFLLANQLVDAPGQILFE